MSKSGTASNHWSLSVWRCDSGASDHVNVTAVSKDVTHASHIAPDLHPTLIDTTHSPRTVVVRRKPHTGIYKT